MHAGTEQLLTIRDGGPLDTVISQHVADCVECRDRLAGLGAIRKELRDLPQLTPPAAVWQNIESRLDTPASRKHGWLGGAIAAAAALVALVVWLNGTGPATEQTARLSQDENSAAIGTTQQLAGGSVSKVTTDDDELDALVTQSQSLELLLRELNSSTPRVMNASTAGTIARLQDGIAFIDYGLSYDEQLNRAQSQQLWQQRVGLMNTLVQVRGAQLQQISN